MPGPDIEVCRRAQDVLAHATNDALGWTFGPAFNTSCGDRHCIRILCPKHAPAEVA